MKKLLITIITAFALICSCQNALAKGGGGGSKAGRNTEKQGKAKTQNQQRKQQQKHERHQEHETAENQKQPRKEQQKQIKKQEQKQERHQNRQQQRVQQAGGQGKGHQQQLRAVETQMNHEQTKHAERMARLRRIRELAAAEGSTKKIERIDGLMQKELQRHESHRNRLQQQKQKALQLSEGTGQPMDRNQPGQSEQKAKKADKGKTEGD